jgi:hypothetical protein
LIAIGVGQKRRPLGLGIFPERQLVIHPLDYLMENMPYFR